MLAAQEEILKSSMENLKELQTRASSRKARKVPETTNLLTRAMHKGAININTDYGLFTQNPMHQQSQDTAELAPDPEIKGSRNSQAATFVKRSQEPSKTNPIISSRQVSHENTQSGLIKIDKENYP